MKRSTNPAKRTASLVAKQKARQIKLLIDQSPAAIPTLAALEKQFRLNKTCLQIGFQEVFGKTIGCYSKEVRLANTKELLKNYHLTLDDIAIRMGYNGSEALCRFFRTMEGITPGVWRKHFADRPIDSVSL